MITTTLILSILIFTDAPVGRWIDTHDDLGVPTAVAARPEGGWAALDGKGERILLMPEARTIDLSRSVHQPQGLAIAQDGSIFVADTGGHRVRFFDPDGQLLGGCGGRGAHPAQQCFPAAVDVNDDYIVVADTGHDRIQVYDRRGAFIRSITGPTESPMRRPEGVAIDAQGRFWIADTHRHRVLCVQPDGSVVHDIGSWGTFPGQFMEPSGVDAIDGCIAVTDRLNHRVQLFDPGTGQLIEHWGMHAFKPREGEGRVHYPTDIAMLDGPQVIVAEPFEERIQQFGPSGAMIEPPQAKPFGTQSHFGPVVATDGRFLCTWEPELRAIHLFDLDHRTPIRISTFGTPGNAPGQLGDLTALAVDADRKLIHAVDAGNGRIQQWAFEPPPPHAPSFNPTMATLRRSAPLPEAGEGDLIQTEETLLYLDRGRRRGLQLSPTGEHRQVDVPEARDPVAAVHRMTPQGPAWAVLDAHEEAIRLYEWPGAKSSSSLISLTSLQDPVDLAVTEDGTFVVVDRGGHRIHHYAADGTPLADWGGQGIEHGKFWRPAAVVVDHQGRIIVLDHGNHRAQMFDHKGTWLMTFGTGRAWTPRPNANNQGASQ